MTIHRPDISALVGSRICHDLISPLGAIGNGLELLTLVGPAASEGPEMELIAQSVENANARVRFFRVAFGAATEGQMIAKSEMSSVLADTYRGGRIEMTATLPPSITRRDAKLALLLVLCLETALPRGGSIVLDGNEKRWKLVAAGDRVTTEPRLWETLTSAPGPVESPLTAAEVQFALLPEAASQAGRALAVNLSSGAVEVRF